MAHPLLLKALEDLDTQNVDEAIAMMQKKASSDPVESHEAADYIKQIQTPEETDTSSDADADSNSDSDSDNSEPTDSSDAGMDSDSSEPTDAPVDDSSESDENTESKDTSEESETKDTQDESNKEEKDDSDSDLSEDPESKETKDSDKESNKPKDESISKEEYLAVTRHDWINDRVNIAIEAIDSSLSISELLESAQTKQRWDMQALQPHVKTIQEATQLLELDSVSIESITALPQEKNLILKRQYSKEGWQEIKEWLLRAVSKVIEFIKDLILALKDYTLDEHEIIDATRRMKENAKKQADLQTKVTKFNEYVSEAKKQFAAKPFLKGASLIAAYPKENDFNMLYDGVQSTFKILGSYWDNLSFNLKSVIRPQMQDVFDFKDGNPLDMIDDNYIVVTDSDYNKNVIDKVDNEKLYIGQALPDEFILKTTSAPMCAAAKIVSITAKRWNRDAVAVALSQNVYQAFITRESEILKDARVLYTEDTKKIDAMIALISAEVSKISKVTQSCMQISNEMERGSKALISYVKSLGQDAVDAQYKREHIRRLNYNLKVFSNMFSKPIYQTYKYTNALVNALYRYTDANYNEVRLLLERIEKRKQLDFES